MTRTQGAPPAPRVPLLRRGGGWPAALLVTALAGVMRVVGLGRPREFMFDETYYAKDAWSLLQQGYSTDFVKGADNQILAGRTEGLLTDTVDMVVHPELGKWLIAGGEWLFGLTPFGWRIASAVVGTLMVLVLIRMVRRLTGSDLLGLTAGVLLTFDGLHLVLSRSALLDIFTAFFVLCAVAALVVDRDWGRARIAALAAADPGRSAAGWGPVRGLRWRPWRLLSGVCFGLACATKWSALYPLAAFGLLVWMWDAGARRKVGVRRARLRSMLLDALPAFGYLVGVGLVVYVLTWAGWLLHAEVYEGALSDTQYGPPWGSYLQTDAGGAPGETVQSLRSLWNYHQDVYTFHTRFLDDAKHTYGSKPEWWPILNRPVGMQAELDIEPGQHGCDAAADSTCLRQVLLLGTPALWWGAAVALLYAGYAWVARRDWRYGLAVVGALSTWLPWIRDDDRPIFSFYAILMLPFTIVALTLLLGQLMGRPADSAARRTWGTAAAGAFVVLVVVNLAWFWPIYTGELLTTPDWLRRIWFERWI